MNSDEEEQRKIQTTATVKNFREEQNNKVEKRIER